MEKIIVAEDQALNLHLIRSQIDHFGLLAKTSLCTDGLQAIETVRNILENPARITEQPITIMLLDFQMPKMNGLQVVQTVRHMYEKHNDAARGVDGQKLKLPSFVFVTAFHSWGLKHLLAKESLTQLYEKPLQDEQVCQILLKSLQEI